MNFERYEERESRSFSGRETLKGKYYYDTVKGEVVIFFYIFFRILYWILLWIYFSFIILLIMMKRYVTLRSHDMSHDVMS